MKNKKKVEIFQCPYCEQEMGYPKSAIRACAIHLEWCKQDKIYKMVEEILEKLKK